MMNEVGVTTLLLTNAAGGINSNFNTGDIMSITDHINFLGTNPLIARKKDNKMSFTDMTTVYDQTIVKQLSSWSSSNNKDLKSGVYLATRGPCYETPAEVRAFKLLGADAVGMSTVPEATLARYLGMKVVAFSCITNKAASIQGESLDHSEVADIAHKSRNKFIEVLQKTLSLI